jgi:HSP20 family protein
MQSDRQRDVPTTRETGRGGTSVTRRQTTTPTFFSVPPGALASAFLADPFAFMNRMSDEMNQWVTTFAPENASSTSALSRGTSRGLNTMWMPQIETLQRDNTLVIRADVPGVKKEDLDVHVENGSLIVSGERTQEKEDNRTDMYRSERSYGSFYREIPLPDTVKEDQISAQCRDGVLEVTVPLPKEQPQQQRKIEVK